MPLNHYERKLYELLKGLTEQDPEGGEGGKRLAGGKIMKI